MYELAPFSRHKFLSEQRWRAVTTTIKVSCSGLWGHTEKDCSAKALHYWKDITWHLDNLHLQALSSDSQNGKKAHLFVIAVRSDCQFVAGLSSFILKIVMTEVSLFYRFKTLLVSSRKTPKFWRQWTTVQARHSCHFPSGLETKHLGQVWKSFFLFSARVYHRLSQITRRDETPCHEGVTRFNQKKRDFSFVVLYILHGYNMKTPLWSGFTCVCMQTIRTKQLQQCTSSSWQNFFHTHSCTMHISFLCRVPTKTNWQNCMTFSWFFQVFKEISRYLIHFLWHQITLGTSFCTKLNLYCYLHCPKAKPPL